MAHSQLTTEQELAKKIRARKEFLNKVCGQIIDLVRKYGKITRRDQGNNHTNVISELHNFGSFTFETNLGQTDFVGDTIGVWYHPGRSFREGGLDFAWDKKWIPVLYIHYQVKGDYEVATFNKNVGWQKALLYILKNKTRIATQIATEIEKEKEKELKKEKKRKQAETDKTKLVEEAQKLGFFQQ